MPDKIYAHEHVLEPTIGAYHTIDRSRGVGDGEMFTEEGHVFWHSGEHEKTCKIPTMTGLGLFGAFAVEETNARGLRFLEFACKNIHTNLAARRKKRHRPTPFGKPPY